MRRWGRPLVTDLESEADSTAEEAAEARKRRRFWRRFTDTRLAHEWRQITLSFIVGVLVLIAIQFPAVEQSFLGGPDREMIETVFKLRTDRIAGVADPVLFLDIDDHTVSKLSPAGLAMRVDTVPRGAIADLLDFMRTAPPNQAPRVVVLDVDIAQPPSDGPGGVAKLQKALTQWAASPSAPPMMISRQTFAASLFDIEGNGSVLPTSPYDDIVQAAPNIYWASPRVTGDQNGEIREFSPFECVVTTTGVKPLYSAALLAYSFTERDQKVLAKAPVRHWMQDGVDYCRKTPDVPLLHGERIDFHFSLETTFLTRVWPDLDPAWPGFKTCGGGDAAMLRRLSVTDILEAQRAGGDIDHGLLCQRIVMIGGTNASAVDFVQTPLNEMNGSVVLANAIRGMEISHGGLRPIPMPFQVILLFLICLAFSASALAAERAQRHYRSLRRRRKQHTLRQRLTFIWLNPIFMNGMIALGAHLLGIAILLVTLNFGMWGFLSAPVFAVAITQTIQEFFDG